MASPYVNQATDGTDLGYNQYIVDLYDTVAVSGDRRGFTLPTPSGSFSYDGKNRALWPTVWINYDTLPAMLGTVRAATNDATLQAAIAASLPGDVITVATGVYTGLYLNWPNNGGDAVPGGNGVVTVIWKDVWDSMVANAGVATVRPQKVRAPAAQLGQGAYFKNVLGGNQEQWAFDGGNVKGWRLIGLSYGVGPGVTILGRIIRIGNGDGSLQFNASQCPSNIIFDRCAVDGHLLLELKNGIEFHGKYNVAVDCLFGDEIHNSGQDCKVIGGYNGPGPFAVVNCRLPGATENIMFGGATSLCGMPSNIDIALCEFYKPLVQNPAHPSYNGRPLSIKNLLEVKAAQKMRVIGNRFHQVWVSGQTGAIFLCKAESYGTGGIIGYTRDVVFIYNKGYDASHGVNIAGVGNVDPAVAVENVVVAYSVLELGAPYFDASNNPFLSMGLQKNCGVIHSTFLSMGSVLSIAQITSSPGLFLLDNIFDITSYGIKGDNAGIGTSSLNMYSVPYDVRRNAFVAEASGSYPTNNFFPATRAAVQFRQSSTHDWALTGTTQGSGTTPPPPTSVLTSVVITPTSVALDPGTTKLFIATGYDQFGVAMAITPSWSVVAGGGAITTGGVFTAGSTAGSYPNTVKVAVGAVVGFASITVNAIVVPPPVVPVLTTLVLTPVSTSLSPGGTQQFAAQGYDQFGSPFAASPVWSIDGPSGTINSTGLYTAGATPGTYTNSVRATVGSVVGRATVVIVAAPVAVLTSIVVSPVSTVLAPAGAQQFSAQGYDQFGGVMAIAPVWSVTAGGGSIDTDGLFTASAAGSYPNTVRATVGAVFGTASVTVNAIPARVLTSLILTPESTSLAAGQTQQFAVTGYDQDGGVMTVAATWQVLPGAGSITQSGLFTAGTAGGIYPGAIRASVGLIFDTADVVVVVVIPPVPPTQKVLTSILVEPYAAILDAGQAQDFSATGFDQFGAVMPFTPVWQVHDGGGSISSTGHFIAGNIAGVFSGTVRAVVGTVYGSASVMVKVGPLTPPYPPPPQTPITRRGVCGYYTKQRRL